MVSKVDLSYGLPDDKLLHSSMVVELLHTQVQPDLHSTMGYVVVCDMLQQSILDVTCFIALHKIGFHGVATIDLRYCNIRLEMLQHVLLDVAIVNLRCRNIFFDVAIIDLRCCNIFFGCCNNRFEMLQHVFFGCCNCRFKMLQHIFLCCNYRFKMLQHDFLDVATVDLKCCNMFFECCSSRFKMLQHVFLCCNYRFKMLQYVFGCYMRF
jgi:hypothetical protein